jgi:hypothetical protein
VDGHRIAARSAPASTNRHPGIIAIPNRGEHGHERVLRRRARNTSHASSAGHIARCA